ncbi:MAG: potassium transporter [Candidatus Methanogaster sp.]|uniref:Potassium transporter n=1 Tax=Candidatus Methanogaster sp. TaxID=3386292 RepID=A0AC61L436_9EURY|nr:MAG: potassium transporter [ANME-2 cluster archaeon]
MNYNTIINLIGAVLRFLGMAMLVPVVVALWYNENYNPFLISAVITFVVGIVSGLKTHEFDDLPIKESFAIVAIGWFLVAMFGSLPYILSEISIMDALFESMSGFTTTGSTILPVIEDYSKSLLFWRSFTQWLGGMGIIVLFLAILPKLAVAGRDLFRAEVPDPIGDKLSPRLSQTAKILWSVYVGLSAVEVFALWLSGMTVYDALCTSFSTMSTGGFSPHSESIAFFHSSLIECIVIFFMFVAGANFALHYWVLRGGADHLFRDSEFRLYTCITFCATLLIALVLWGTYGFDSIRLGLFQVVSIVTTTGFATADFDTWPNTGRMALFLLLFVGGCAGSTGGGAKVVRLLLLIKYGYSELFRSLHPKAILPIRLGRQLVPQGVMEAVLSFFILYIFIFAVASLILSIIGMDVVSATSAAATTLGNVGPGFNTVGPAANFSGVHPIGKLVSVLCMWIGRLEIFTVLVLLIPDFWRK